jgi:coenzyme F420-reducing hydrogenase beta subunit
MPTQLCALDRQRCTECGLCRAVCSNWGAAGRRLLVGGDLAGLTTQVFGAPRATPAGHSRGDYLAHATQATSAAALSAGVTTALLQYALASGRMRARWCDDVALKAL